MKMQTISLSEWGILRQIRDGDKDAFGVLFSQYYAPLCVYAASILKFSEPAREVVQETFIRIWENRKDFVIHASLRGYLYRSVHNNCLSYVKGEAANHKRDIRMVNEITYHAELATRNLKGESLESMITGELEEFLEGEINQLPDQCRKVFYLIRYDQLTYQEVANKLSISVNTVKTQLSRAFSKLRIAVRKFENI